MTTLKHILVGVDYSSASESALLAVKRMAERDGATLTAANVIETDPSRLQWRDLLDLSEDEARERLANEHLRHMRGLFNDCGIEDVESVERKVVFGWTPRRLPELAEELDCDLLTISSGGHTVLGRLFLGSTADRLVRYARVPVLIVRPGHERRARNIVVGVDFTPASEAALAWALEEGAREGAVVHVVHAYGDPGEPSWFSAVSEEDWSRFRQMIHDEAEQTFTNFVQAKGLEGRGDVRLALLPASRPRLSSATPSASRPTCSSSASTSTTSSGSSAGRPSSSPATCTATS